MITLLLFSESQTGGDTYHYQNEDEIFFVMMKKILFLY